MKRRGTNELHVVPSGDFVDHYSFDDCPCGPTAEPVKRDDGSVGWVYVHHALDGRTDLAEGVEP